MKLLYYSPHPHLSIHAPTGYGTHMREMITAFRAHGMEVMTLIAGDLVAPADTVGSTSGSAKGKLRNAMPPLFWECLKDIQRLRFDHKMKRKLEDAIRTFSPDVVYERVAYLQTSGVRAASGAGVRHIAEINAPFPEERVAFSGNSLLLNKARSAEREILKSTNAVSVVSSALASYLGKICPGVMPKIHVIPNCINPDDAHSNPELVAKLRMELNLIGKKVVGFVGSIFPYHGVDILIESFALLQADARLLIVGDGASLPELKDKVRNAGIEEKVIFTGSVPHNKVYAYMELMDICCMAKSNWYGSPVKLFEYGLAGKAILAPDVQPVRDVMDDTTALIVKPEVASVHNAMERLLNDEALRARLARAWHAKVLDRYTWKRAAQTIGSLCE